MNDAQRRLSDVEQHTMLATWRSGTDAFGATIRDAIAEATGRRLTVSAVYSTLVRLEERGLVSSTLTDPAPVRGGKAKRRFTVTPRGISALQAARRDFERLWEGLDHSAEYRSS